MRRRRSNSGDEATNGMMQQRPNAVKQPKLVGEHHEGNFGVYMHHKIEKLRQQHEQRERVSAIFQQVTVYVNGYTVPSKEQIRELLLQHGGHFEEYQTRRVTHMIATHIPHTKVIQLSKEKNPVPIVHPKWIVDSIEQEKLLPTAKYMINYRNNASQQSILSLASSDSASEHLPELISKNEQAEAKKSDEDQRKHSPIASKIRSISSKDGAAFIKSFFENSRLHHIGSWRAHYQQLAVKHYDRNKDKHRPSSDEDRLIMHIDMDCFFVSVAIRDRPELSRLPIAIAHSASESTKGGYSEVSSCNYIAREAGVCASMFMGEAKKLCPNLVVLPYEFDKIQEVSDAIYEIFFAAADFVEPVSCDEAFLQFYGHKNPSETAQNLRRQIYQRTGCPASAGISYNKLLSRLATKRAKPNGQYEITAANAEEFMKSLKISEIPGVGWKTMKKMKQINIDTCGQLWALEKATLQEHFGMAMGSSLYDSCRGVDKSELRVDFHRKSVSAEINYGIRFENNQEAKDFIIELSKELSKRMHEIEVTSKSFTLKIKRKKAGSNEPKKFMGHGSCGSNCKSVCLAQVTTDPTQISSACYFMLQQMEIPSEEVRGVGIQANKLVSLKSLSPEKNSSSGVLGQWLSSTNEDSQKHSDQERIIPNAFQAAISNVTCSQIDPEAFNSLPKELRLELAELYKIPLLKTIQTIPKDDHFYQETIDEVKDVLPCSWTKEGVEEKESLSDEDLHELHKYVTYHINSRRMDVSLRILQWFRRLAVAKAHASANSPCALQWPQQYNQLLDAANALVQKKYQSSLALQSI